MDVEPIADLSDLGVLIPRPKRVPDKFVDLLRSRGCNPYLMPVIEIVSDVDSSFVQSAIPSLKEADGIIFVSARAVEHCLQALAKTGSRLPETSQYFAVGRSTAERLTALGYQVHFPIARATSEGLLELPELSDVRRKKIYICRGKDGRDKLGMVLRDRGADVEYLDLYRRAPLTNYGEAINLLIGAGKVQSIVVHSSEIWSAFFALLDSTSIRKLADLAILTPGQRMAAFLQGEGVQNLVVAANALPEEMVAALVGWYTER